MNCAMNVMLRIFQLYLCLCNVYCVVFVFHQQWVARAASELCDERDASAFSEEFSCGAVLGAKFKV